MAVFGQTQEKEENTIFRRCFPAVIIRDITFRSYRRKEPYSIKQGTSVVVCAIDAPVVTQLDGSTYTEDGERFIAKCEDAWIELRPGKDFLAKN